MREFISTGRLSFTILPSIAHLQRDLAKMREWRLYSIARALYGPLVTLKLHSRTRNLLLKKRERWDRLLL